MKKTILNIVCASVFCFSAGTANANLIAYYSFEGNALDVSGNGYHASIVAGVTLTTGHTGLAYDFDGSNDYITIPLNINPSALSSITMGAWVQSNTTGSIKKVISHDNGGYDRTLGIDTRAGGGWSAFTGSGVLGNQPVSTGSWQFVAVTYDQVAQNIMLYVDGVTQSTAGIQGTGHATTRIGGNPSFNEYFNGRIDDVFFYDEALSIAELDDIRLNGVSAVPIPTAAWLFASSFIGLIGMRRKIIKSSANHD